MRMIVIALILAGAIWLILRPSTSEISSHEVDSMYRDIEIPAGMFGPADPREGWRTDARTPEGSTETQYLFDVLSENVITIGPSLQTRPRMVIECFDGHTELFMYFTSLVSPDAFTMNMKMDGDTAELKQFSSSLDTPGKTTLIDEHSELYVYKLTRATTLDVEFTPMTSATQTFRFNIEGLEDIILPSHKFCGFDDFL